MKLIRFVGYALLLGLSLAGLWLFTLVAIYGRVLFSEPRALVLWAELAMFLLAGFVAVVNLYQFIREALHDKGGT